MPEGDGGTETYAFCPGCGKDRVPGASFCSACGRSLVKEKDTASGSTQRQSPPPPPSPPPGGMTPSAQPPPPRQDIPSTPYTTYGAPSGYMPPSAVRLAPSGTTSALLSAAFVFAFLFWPVGIILGHIARSTIRRTGERGEGLALAALIISYVWGAAVIIIIIIALAGSGSSGYNNLTTLQDSVTQQINGNLHNPSNSAYSPGTSVTSTLCVHNSGTQFTCLVTASDGSKSSISVTVSSDGSRWVSN